MAKRMKMIRDHGQAKKYYHDIEGYNGRLDSIQAGWLSVKLRHLANWNARRREIAHRYHSLLSGTEDGLVIPQEAGWTKGVYHLYVVRVRDREAFQTHLTEAGIGSGIHYPIPLHLQKAYQHLGYVDSALATGTVPKSAEADHEFGPVLEIWEGFASDPEVRMRASSGGLLTALSLYCLEREGMASVLHTGQDPEKPWLNKTVQSRGRSDLLQRTGSRYAPASPCDGLRDIENSSEPCVFVGN